MPAPDANRCVQNVGTHDIIVKPSYHRYQGVAARSRPVNVFGVIFWRLVERHG